MSTGWAFTDWLQYMFSFALVIGLLLGLLWALRRIQNSAALGRKSSPRLRHIESLSVGPRQKIILIQVDGQDVLIGMTPHQMTALSTCPASVSAKHPTTTEEDKP